MPLFFYFKIGFSSVRMSSPWRSASLATFLVNNCTRMCRKRAFYCLCLPLSSSVLSRAVIFSLKIELEIFLVVASYASTVIWESILTPCNLSKGRNGHCKYADTSPGCALAPFTPVISSVGSGHYCFGPCTASGIQKSYRAIWYFKYSGTPPPLRRGSLTYTPLLILSVGS